VLTIHADAHGAAVAVDGDRIVAVGTPAEVTAAHPGARVRQWPGRLTRGRTHRGELPQAPSPRERVHALLRGGVTAVAGEQPDPRIRSALARAGLDRVTPAELTPGGRADFTVFDDATGDACTGARARTRYDAADGACAAPCVATVLAGRLVHRRT
jgi:predicted amidohydrolase YtcJ